MADIIEAFVVSIGLDPTNHKKQIADFKSDLKGAREEAHSTALSVESDNKRMIESFSRLRNEIVGLALVAAGANSVRGLLGDMVHGAAETGRLATNLGMATEQVSAWEGAVRSMGGTAQDAQTALRQFNTEYQTYLLTGHTAHDQDYAALGIGPNDLRSPMSLISALAGRSEQMDRTQFVARAERLGIPDSVINTLARGRRGVQDLIEEQYRLGVVTRADAQAAIEFERQWANLTTQLRSELRPVLTWLVEQALPWIEQHGPEVARILGVGIAGSIGLMALALVRAAGPLGIVIAGLTAIISLWDRAGSGFRIWYVGQQIATQRAALRSVGELDRDANGNPVISDANRERAARRAEILQNIADLEADRLGQVRQFHGATAPTAGGTRWQRGMDYGPGGGGGVAAGNYQSIRSWFLRNGLPEHQASAMAGHIMAESGGRLNNNNHTGGGNGARGIYQWRGQRQRNFQRIIGRPIDGSSMDDQLRFIMWELRGGDPGGPSVLRSRTTEEALSNAIYRYGRPDARGAAQDFRFARQYIAGGGARLAQRGGGATGGGSVSVGTIVVNVPHGTPQAQAERVAREVPRAVARRGVVTQANSGLK